MDKQCEELIYSVTEKIKRLMDYLIKAREVKKANGHFVHGRITMFQNQNKPIDILTGNLAILEETLVKIEQLAGNLNVVTNNRPEEKHSPAMQLPTSGL